MDLVDLSTPKGGFGPAITLKCTNLENEEKKVSIKSLREP